MRPIVVFTALLLVAGPALAEREWYRYENEYFVVLSDDSKRTVRNAVKHLELFRAAVIQLANIKVPDDAPKVRVVLLSSHMEFRSLTDNIWLPGAVIEIDGMPHIVVATSDKSRFTEWTLRHMYSHILLEYKNFDYPNWFSEGFAQLMSPTDFKNRNRTFTVGQYPGRTDWDKRFWVFEDFGDTSVTPWEELLDIEFDIHSYDSLGDRYSAQLQCWMLVYYFMLDDELGNAAQLQEYLALLSQGHDSVEAMESVVGEPVANWANQLRRTYVNQVQKYYSWDLDEPVQHDKLSERVEIPGSEVAPVFDQIRGTKKHVQ